MSDHRAADCLEGELMDAKKRPHNPPESNPVLFADALDEMRERLRQSGVLPFMWESQVKRITTKWIKMGKPELISEAAKQLQVLVADLADAERVAIEMEQKEEALKQECERLRDKLNDAEVEYDTELMEQADEQNRLRENVYRYLYANLWRRILFVFGIHPPKKTGKFGFYVVGLFVCIFS